MSILVQFFLYRPGTCAKDEATALGEGVPAAHRWHNGTPEGHGPFSEDCRDLEVA